MKPHTFDSYKDRYETISLDRSEDGILTMKLHERGNTDGAVRYDVDYDWSHPHTEWSYCLNDIARDYENEILIITNAGNDHSTEESSPFVSGAGSSHSAPVPVPSWDWSAHNGKFLQMNTLNVECPVIGAIQGQAVVHADMLTQSDVVLCTEDTVLQDLPHFESGAFAAGDGVSLHWQSVLGPNRGRYFLMTGQTLTAEDALNLGVVQDVLPKEKLVARAEELARDMLRRPKLVRRYTRIIGTHKARQEMMDHVGYGLALEGSAAAAGSWGASAATSSAAASRGAKNDG